MAPYPMPAGMMVMPPMIIRAMYIMAMNRAAYPCLYNHILRLSGSKRDNCYHCYEQYFHVFHNLSCYCYIIINSCCGQKFNRYPKATLMLQSFMRLSGSWFIKIARTLYEIAKCFFICRMAKIFAEKIRFAVLILKICPFPKPSQPTYSN